MTPYAIALFCHFLGMIGLFVGYGLEWTGSALLRKAATSDQARSALGLYRLSLPISGPGLLLLILSGGYLASIIGRMRQGWISGALLAILVALVIGFVFILPRIRAVRAAIPQGSAPLPEAALARANNPMIVTLVRVRFLLAVGIVYLMTAKPPAFTTSLFVLLIAIVVGLLASASAWTKSRG
jgi:hypothetical protein